MLGSWSTLKTPYMVLVETLNSAEHLIWTCSCRHQSEKKNLRTVCLKFPAWKSQWTFYVLLSEFAIKFKSCADVLLKRKRNKKDNDRGLAGNTLQPIFRPFSTTAQKGHTQFNPLTVCTPVKGLCNLSIEVNFYNSLQLIGHVERYFLAFIRSLRHVLPCLCTSGCDFPLTC